MSAGKAEDPLGDAVKRLEAMESERRLDGPGPICMRLDGRGFSRFTRDFRRPFDPHVSAAMRTAAQRLVEDMRPCIAYVQSDEITLVFAEPSIRTPIFDGRVQKLCSVAAASAAAAFSLALIADGHADKVTRRLPVFDARAWQVPDRRAAAKALLWRGIDARRNAVSAVCRSVASHAEMQGLDRHGMLALMATRGVDMERDVDPNDRFGTLLRRETGLREIPEETWAKIPPAKRPPSREVERSSIEPLTPVFLGRISNLVEVVFDGAEIVLRDRPPASEPAP